ncbi:helix-turn-helix domain-containing protein [Empedobacter sp. GD03865]|uniref:helix-turn-helix domain-containing protein n=1 Tax=Empedobacter sp. GD03865 TaxID=2975392 RepID=UPI00244A782B|nr:helix-turn-helix domain-containing protein [Empedobacter sp. GD03865]MDH0658616.1 helix-turn-helix domain containing protein [Empedobacter sp. GD03865]
MDQKIHITIPNYKRIYSDILTKKYPEKKEVCSQINKKENLSVLDIISLNEKIFGTNPSHNQKLRSYFKSDIIKILDYQKKHNLNNSQLASHFNLSRNTVAKWKKKFLV